MTENKIMKTVKVETKFIDKAKEMKLSTNEYLTYLVNLAESNKSRTEEILLERTNKLEGYIQSLIQQNISRRASELTLEKELRQMHKSNEELKELILSKFSFITALEKELTK